MSQSKSTKLAPRQKLLLLIASIFIIPALVAIGWYFFAGKLQTTIEEKITQLAGSGKTVTCNNLEMRGFPFRIGIHCSHTAYDDNNSRIGLTAGAIRTAAQIYNPGHIVSELDGPIQITSKSTYLETNWNNLQASTNLDLSGISRASIKASNIRTQIIEPTALQIGSVTADNFEIHVRQNENNLDFATSTLNMNLIDKSGNTAASDIEFSLVSTVVGRAKTLQFGNDIFELNLRGTSINLHEALLLIGDDTTLSLSGPMSFSDAGLMSGEIDLKIENAGNFLKIIAPYTNQSGVDLNAIAPLLSAFSTNGNSDNLQIKLLIKDGVVRAGLFPIGTIPAI